MTVENVPRVSILIPLYNYGQYVGECIASVLSQTYPDLELVISDNGSTDRSYDAARDAAGDDPRVTIHHFDDTVEIIENWRRCYRRSSGPLVHFLPADDRFASNDAVERMVAAFQSDSEVALCLSRQEIIDEDGMSLGSENPEYPSDFIMDGRAYGDYMLMLGLSPLGYSFMFRREYLPDDLIVMIGDYEVRNYSDMLFMINILSRGKLAFINDVLENVRFHSRSETRRTRLGAMWLVDHWKIINGALQLGYLSNPSAERAALMSLQRQSTGHSEYSNVMQDPEAQNIMSQMSLRIAQLPEFEATDGSAPKSEE